MAKSTQKKRPIDRWREEAGGAASRGRSGRRTTRFTAPPKTKGGRRPAQDRRATTKPRSGLESLLRGSPFEGRQAQRRAAEDDNRLAREQFQALMGGGRQDGLSPHFFGALGGGGRGLGGLHRAIGNLARGAADSVDRAGRASMDAAGRSAFRGVMDILDQVRDMGREARGYSDYVKQNAPAFAEPDLASYLAPYEQAEKAAQESYDHGTGVITDSYGRLGEKMRASQAEYEAAMGASNRQAREARALTADSGREIVEGSLAQSLGLTNDLQAQAGLLAETDRQAAQAADLLAQQAVSAQQANNASAVESLAGAEANAQGVAARNLSQLLSQIGLEKAGAQRQYEQDLNQVRMANAQAQQQAHQQYLEMVNAEAKQRADWEKEQERFIKGATRDAWGSENVRLRQNANPKATEFFLKFLDHVGGSRDIRSAQRAHDELSDRIERYENEFKVRLNERVLRNWIDEYYSKARTFIPNLYEGDPDYARQRGVY